MRESTPESTPSVQMPFEKRELFFLLALIAVGAFFRFYRLTDIPPGFHFDQAFYVFDAVRLLQGEFYIFFAAPGGSEPFYLYLSTVGVSLFGVSAFGLKLTSAVLGTILIPVIYGFARTFLRSRFAAGIAATLATISVWLIFYSRDGERAGLQVLFALLTLGFFWRAATQYKMSAFVYSGIFLGLSLYTYPAARVTPILLALLTAYLVLSERASVRAYLRGIVLIFGIAALLFLPLGLYFVAHPDQLLSHSADVSVFSSATEPKGIALALAENAQRILKMFFIEGDNGIIRNVPGRPVFDAFVAPFFISGVIVAGIALFRTKTDAARLNHKRAVFLFAWIGLALAISLISDDAPNFVRVLQSAPALFIVAAWGVLTISQYFRTPVLQRAGIVLLAGIFVVSSALAFRDYFVMYGTSPALYYAFDADKVEIANWINAQAKSNRVFLAPLYAQQGTISLLTRNALLDSFDSRDTIVLPLRAAGRDAYYAFPPEQAQRVKTLAERLGIGERADVIGSNGAPILLVYHVPAEKLPTTANALGGINARADFLKPIMPSDASWENKIRLSGARIEVLGLGSRQLFVTLMLQALDTMPRAFTFSVKVRGEDGKVWGQQDKMPGSNSYPTTQWTTGDIVIERFLPEFDECPPPGKYTVTVELYAADDNATLPLDNRNENVLELDTVRARENCVWVARNSK